MSNPLFFRAKRNTNPRSSRRRPTGVSRRQRKKQLGFETLEDRRVMSADSSLIAIPLDISSFSSADSEGAEQILLREIQRYAEQVSSSQIQVSTNSIPTDPLTFAQWHLINTGQEVGNEDFQNIFAVPGEDLNVAPVWQLGITGDGVVVAVIDSGVEFTHPDLAANIDPALQLDAIDNDNNASPTLSSHGTAVSGIIGAVANNNRGGTGIAHGAQIVPIRLIDAGQTPQGFIDAFRFEIDKIDITNNSWGPGVVRGLSGPSPLQTLALRDSIFFGRPDDNGDALGVIHVFSAGNDGELYSSSSYNGWVNSRYTIGVTGVDHDGEYNNVDGTVTSYPETSASVLVAAPTGSNTIGIVEDSTASVIGSGIVTTDLTGEDGSNGSDNTGFPLGDRDFLEDIDYTSSFNGTSASAPMVSGVIALMLEANPNLSWRDVQDILVRSSRQNAEFATQANGVDKAVGIEYQNTWIVNQVPLFHDPDTYNPLIENGLQIFHPTLDKEFDLGLNAIHYAPTPQVLTNGAGFTVGQGRGTNRENFGFAHGVVDAELAVLLSLQWHTKGQALADELTFTTAVTGSPNLPAAEVVNDVFGTQDIIIPGGLSGGAGFGAYWAEYLVDDPDFGQTFFARGLPEELTVPSPNDMVVETLEVTVTIDGGPMNEFLDNVRVVLVSPNGTHSELNHYFVDPSFQGGGRHHQVDTPLPTGSLLGLNGFDAVTSNPIDFFDPGSADTGINTFTFSTNRNWGERSDDAIVFDPSTREPSEALFAGNSFNLFATAGTLSTQGWQLYMENYSPTAFGLTSYEFAWHGEPIEANTERIQGLIGIDDNQDDAFNYSRVIQTIVQIDNDPALRLGEIQNLIDPNHESMAANVTVFAHRDVNADGILDPTDILVDQFVTGADGNYYFDLVPDNYIFSLDQESLVGLTALDDSTTPNGLLQKYQTEWAVSTEYFQVWDYDANLEVPLDASGAPLPYLDATDSAVTYGMRDINFLLDPGTPVAPQVDFTGSIFADINGDGVFNTDDVAVPGVGVFADLNRNGEFDAGEALTTTNASGQYALTVPLLAPNVVNIGVRPPADWVAKNPDTGFSSFFVKQGDAFSGVDFHIQPPSVDSTGDGSALSGIILGTVFNDKNADKARQGDESGVPNQTVYLDLNNSGSIDAGDRVTQTNSNGAYAFADIPNGSHFLRIDLDPTAGVTQTFPDFGFPQLATITLGGTDLTVDFGISNGSGTGGGPGGGGGGPGAGFFDFGDLPDAYGTRLVDNGPRHPEGIFFLGTKIDSEQNGIPSTTATGDDSNFLSDEDGVVLTGGSLVPGSTNTVTVTASRHGGFLQSWMDFNNDGDFEDIIDGVSEYAVVNELLDAGVNTVSFDIPLTVVGSTVYARFRYGEFGLGSTGLAQVGEVEDYAFAVDTATGSQGTADPDFDGDGDVDGADFLAWQRGVGLQANASQGNGDANKDGAVNSDDLAFLQGDFGQSSSQAIAAVQGGGGETDGLSFYGNGYGNGVFATTLGPRITQPGFREDLVDGIVVADDTRSSVGRGDIASIASEAQRRASQGQRPAYAPHLRNASRSVERVDAGRDQNLAQRDQAFATRQEPSAPVSERAAFRALYEADEAEALALALEEALDWRLN